MKVLILFSFLAVSLGSLVERVAEPQAVPCKMTNGQPRPFPCEFEILTLWFMGKNNEVLGKVTPTSTSVKLPKSKALSSESVSGGGVLSYNVSVDFRRINTPSFSTPTYTLSRSSITNPISPGESTPINSAIKVSPNLPPEGIRPNRVMFKLQLNYGNSGGQPTLIAPIQLVLLENPVTYNKLPKSVSQFIDRAEDSQKMTVSVDFTK